MEEALRFIRTYEALFYLGLGGLALWEIRKFALAWEEVRGAAFGLERESAQGRLNRAAVMLVLILSMGLAEFVLVSFVAPTVPGATPLLTPTIDLLATPTATLPASTNSLETPEAEATPTPDGWPPPESGCIPESLMITSPMYGENISGRIVVEGTVQYPNFSFYKYEIKRPDDPIWHTLQASREMKVEEVLGEWDTHLLAQGDYLLRLVAIDTEGQELGICEIPIRLIPSQQTP
jgi:hypothetical protein